mmetsp:Transcript_47827/g.150015  ORF Transcript_47827/g.150015 Transcript_47827/m.150015 type:complete len:211 (-) Transcript_47827:189-821(-)
MIVQQADKVVSANNSCRFLLTSDVLPQLSHLNMKKLYLLLLCCSAKFTLSIKTFDLQNCTTASPCCISSDMTSNYLGSLTNSFCKIEYPVRVTENWDKMLAAKLDVAAKAEWEKLTKNDGCGSEACKGYICANLFPRCFYLNESAQGSFLFETCRETCNDCLSSCAKDRSTECLVNPSQYESACTSIANVNRQDVGVVVSFADLSPKTDV